jgi:hypothetical protein
MLQVHYHLKDLMSDLQQTNLEKTLLAWCRQNTKVSDAPRALNKQVRNIYYLVLYFNLWVMTLCCDGLVCLCFGDVSVSVFSAKWLTIYLVTCVASHWLAYGKVLWCDLLVSCFWMLFPIDIHILSDPPMTTYSATSQKYGHIWIFTIVWIMMLE